MLQLTFRNPVIQKDMEEMAALLPEKEELRYKRIYISGAGGMIASYMAGFLIWLNEMEDAHIQIYAGIRNLGKAKARYGKYADAGYFHLMQDDVNLPFLPDGKMDYIIHAASLASPQYYGKNPVETMLPNVIGTYQLLEYCRQNPVQSFMLFSSGAVYGSVQGVETITENIRGTFDFSSINNCYGESKRCGEALCGAYWSEFGIPAKIARIHHTYGPTADVLNDKRVFSEFANNVIQGQNIVLKSTGDARRAFCYLTDMVVGLYKVLLAGENGTAYNIGNPGEYIRMKDLAALLTALFPEKGLSVKQNERQDEGYAASPEIRTSPVDVIRLENLHWKPQISASEGFKRMISAIEYDLRLNKGEA